MGDGLNESLIKKDEDCQSSEDEVEKEVSVEKDTSQDEAVSTPAVAAEVIQEVDFEAKYQRFLQNEEMEEREVTSMTALMGGGTEEENIVENKDEADFCLMTDKPQELLNAVPTLENTLVLAGADEKKDDAASSSSEDEEEEEGGKNDQESEDEEPEEANIKEEMKMDQTEIVKMEDANVEVQPEMPVSE